MEKVSSIRTHFVIMLVLYGSTWLIINNIVIRQQQTILQQYRNEKTSLEYDYMKLKNYPDYVNTIRKTINNAGNKLNQFLWINTGYDPNLMVFQHISSIAERLNLEITGFQPAEKVDEKYYTWNVSCKGNFSGILSFINGIETSQKFLKIDSVEITSFEDGISVSLKVSGIKKLE
ncbi:MAG TPA: hypothetical protein PK303_02610 [bacterium]|nr:hypothetical protein [bacterium]HOL34340.1 hypothetical protein [bacterium]HPP07998.1 hypothetical protein [bacterium]